MSGGGGTRTGQAESTHLIEPNLPFATAGRGPIVQGIILCVAVVGPGVRDEGMHLVEIGRDGLLEELRIWLAVC